jgi:hypothetical protein
LAELPETLDETYERILGGVDDEKWEYTQRLLLYVAAASRPFLVEELAEIPERIQRALDASPETLDKTYERILGDIDDEKWQDAQRLLLCVAAASRPLLVEELADILAFDFTTGSIPRFHENRRPKNPSETVLSACSSLLVLVNVDGSQVIQFSHFSAKEFLMSPRFAEKRDIISRRYHISMTYAHTFVARACIGIILHLDSSHTRGSLPCFPLAQYAGKH